MGKYNTPLVPKKAKTPTFNMTDAQLASMREVERRQGYLDAIYACNAFYSAAMLMELHDTLGFGQTRLKRVFDRVQKLFRALSDGDVSYMDVAGVLMDECDINLIVEMPDGAKHNALEIYKAATKGAQIRMVFGKRGNPL